MSGLSHQERPFFWAGHGSAACPPGPIRNKPGSMAILRSKEITCAVLPAAQFCFQTAT
jgi:hypothetical protein